MEPKLLMFEGWTEPPQVGNPRMSTEMGGREKEPNSSAGSAKGEKRSHSSPRNLLWCPGCENQWRLTVKEQKWVFGGQAPSVHGEKEKGRAALCGKCHGDRARGHPVPPGA